MNEKVLDILKKEDVRLIDGRYSDGFVNTDALEELVAQGVAEVYYNEGMRFVRLVQKVA